MIDDDDIGPAITIRYQNRFLDDNNFFYQIDIDAIFRISTTNITVKVSGLIEK